jgi:hypothetical protein
MASWIVKLKRFPAAIERATEAYVVSLRKGPRRDDQGNAGMAEPRRKVQGHLEPTVSWSKDEVKGK